MTNGARNLPPDWEWVRLRDVVVLNASSTRPEAGRTYLYVGLEDVASHTGELLHTHLVDGSRIGSRKYEFDQGNVLYGKLRPALNKVALPDSEGVCSTDLIPIRPRDSLLREYLAHWLRSPSFVDFAVRHASGTKMPRIEVATLLNAPIPVTSTETQVQIVQLLSQADAIRRKRRAALELADSVLPSTFLTMFGDPTANPKGWEAVPLGDVAEIKSGVTKGRDLGGRSVVSVPYLRVANVQDGYLDLDDVRQITVLPQDAEKYRLEDGDVLMTEGGDPDKLGRGAISRNEVAGCIHQNHVFRVRTDRQRLLPEFLAALLRTSHAKTYFLRSAKRSSNLASINAGQVRTFPVPLPSLRLQTKFVMAAAQWQQTIQKQVLASKEADQLYSSLASFAFRGELIIGEPGSGEQLSTIGASP